MCVVRGPVSLGGVRVPGDGQVQGAALLLPWGLLGGHQPALVAPSLLPLSRLLDHCPLGQIGPVDVVLSFQCLKVGRRKKKMSEGCLWKASFPTSGTQGLQRCSAPTRQPQWELQGAPCGRDREGPALFCSFLLWDTLQVMCSHLLLPSHMLALGGLGLCLKV